MLNWTLDFAAVGPQRTATTWLYQALYGHPSLCFPQGVKETFFFDERYAKGLDWYRAHFAYHQPGQACAEMAPTYFDVAAVPQRLHAHNPHCRIVVTLRHPVARTWSLYRHHLAKGRVTDSFEAATQQMPRILTAGHYATHLPRWLDAFGAEQVKCLLLDDIQTAPEAALQALCQFLEISVPEESANHHTPVNAATTPRSPQLARLATQAASLLRAYRLHAPIEWGKRLGLKRIYSGGSPHRAPQLTPERQQQLLARYEPDVRYLEDLLGRDLTAWRQPIPTQE